MSNVNKSELGSADNVIPSRGRCSSNGSKKKKYAARGDTKRERERERKRNRMQKTKSNSADRLLSQLLQLTCSLIYDSIDGIFLCFLLSLLFSILFVKRLLDNSES